MRCPTCIAEGRESHVHDRGSSTTLMAGDDHFFDEKGEPHYHPINRQTTRYECSLGHSWTHVTKHTCWCGWESRW